MPRTIREAVARHARLATIHGNRAVNAPTLRQRQHARRLRAHHLAHAHALLGELS